MILDTNALSAFVDGEERVRAAMAAHARAAIPVIVLGEFQYGIAQSRHRSAYDGWLVSYLKDFEVLTVSEDTASSYARVRLALKRLGRPIPANDAWIAALALEHGMPILTRDAHFEAVSELVRRVAW